MVALSIAENRKLARTSAASAISAAAVARKQDWALSAPGGQVA